MNTFGQLPETWIITIQTDKLHASIYIAYGKIKCQNAEKMHFIIIEMKENYKECTMEKINEEISKNI